MYSNNNNNLKKCAVTLGLVKLVEQIKNEKKESLVFGLRNLKMKHDMYEKNKRSAGGPLNRFIKSFAVWNGNEMKPC